VRENCNVRVFQRVTKIGRRRKSIFLYMSMYARQSHTEALKGWLEARTGGNTMSLPCTFLMNFGMTVATRASMFMVCAGPSRDRQLDDLRWQPHGFYVNAVRASRERGLASALRKMSKSPVRRFRRDHHHQALSLSPPPLYLPTKSQY
jgi:hypothetical protein